MPSTLRPLDRCRPAVHRPTTGGQLVDAAVDDPDEPEGDEPELPLELPEPDEPEFESVVVEEPLLSDDDLLLSVLLEDSLSLGSLDPLEPLESPPADPARLSVR